MVEMIHDSYGKADVRVMKAERDADVHRITELSVDIHLQGDLAETYTDGDNTRVLPTDTMKNTVYALARSHPVAMPERFGLILADHFVDSQPQIKSATIEIAKRPWNHIDTGDGPEPHAFVQDTGERRIARVSHSADDITTEAGVRDLVILKSADSGFSGFVEDQYTTLEETDDRVLATSLEAIWTYERPNVDFDELYGGVRRTLLDVFADHDSLSVQHTLHAMGTVVLERFGSIEQIHLEMPNKHNLPVDLEPFGTDNPHQILKPIDEPSGLIEATLKR